MQDESVNAIETLELNHNATPGLGRPNLRLVSYAPPALTVATDGQWFVRPGAERINLSTRRALRRILAHLVKMHAKSPGQPRTVRQIQAAGWPGERMLPKSGADRVYTAIRTLRRFGLTGILVTKNGGYMLDPKLTIERS